MRSASLLLVFGVGCASQPQPYTTLPDAPRAKGPWPEVPAVEMPSGDTSIPISLLQDVADALLMRPGAKVCDPVTHRPIVGLSTEYCSTVYVAGTSDALSWRVTEPVRGDHDSCRPFFAVADDDYPSSQVWVVGYVHNHPCATTVSSDDLSAWPTDAFNPLVSMAELRLVPGNPAPAGFKNSLIEMASALVAERQDGIHIFLRYFSTGEIQQWSHRKSDWITLGICAPGALSPYHGTLPRCQKGSVELLRE